MIHLPTDTRKDIAEEAVLPQVANEEGFVECYMPGRKNDIMFIKFDSDTSRRRFLNNTLSKELEVKFRVTVLKPLKCRTESQKERTKHIDKFKRVVCEAIRAKYPDTTDEVIRDKITTGMNGGGVGWIGETRVA